MCIKNLNSIKNKQKTSKSVNNRRPKSRNVNNCRPTSKHVEKSLVTSKRVFFIKLLKFLLRSFISTIYHLIVNIKHCGVVVF